MLIFHIDSPLSNVLHAIQATQVYRAHPPHFCSRERFSSTTLIGGTRKGKYNYWIAAREKSSGEYYGYKRYFIYKALPVGMQTMIHGKFVFPLWYNIYLYVGVLLAFLYLFTLGGWTVSRYPLRAYVGTIILVISIDVIEKLICRSCSIKIEKIVINYFRKLEKAKWEDSGSVE